MENQQTILDKAIKVSSILAIFIASFSVAYYYIFFLPQNTRKTLDSQKQEQETKEKVLKHCNQWAIDTAKNDDLEYETEEDYNFYFKQCLRDQGLEK